MPEILSPNKKLFRKMTVTSSNQIYDCGLFRLNEETATDHAGYDIKRAVIRHRGSAAILVVDARKRVLLVRQYRLPAGGYLWELPAGGMDEGETPLQTARRELREETGYRAKKWTKLGAFYTTPGFVAEKINLFLAQDLTGGDAQWMDDERIELGWFTRKEMDDLIAAGKLNDGKTLIAYLIWRRSK